MFGDYLENKSKSILKNRIAVKIIITNETNEPKIVLKIVFFFYSKLT